MTDDLREESLISDQDQTIELKGQVPPGDRIWAALDLFKYLFNEFLHF